MWFVTGAGLAVVVMLAVLSATRADAAPGDTDTTFVPITPGCRFADTRQVGQGPTIGPKQVRTFTAHGTNNDCTIPNDAVGLLMNITVDGRTAPNSFLTVWGNGNNPGTSALNPAAGQPPTPNAVTTDLTPTGQFKIYNDAGSVHVIIDIGGYYTRSSLQDLAARVADLEAKTASMSASVVDGHPTVRFTGVNVQLVDGSGDTHCSFTGFEPCNGLGNLIVGYSEDQQPGSPRVRTGSHNAVVGLNHSWSSSAGLVAGQTNTISGLYATVTGGANNRATALGSSVSGGKANAANGIQSSVSGGNVNEANGEQSSVSGGNVNEANGEQSSVSGGHDNTASGERSSVSGGADNIASNLYSSVSGGEQNLASGQSASVTGGRTNWATGQQSSATGGRDNRATGTRTTVLGGAACNVNIGNGVHVGSPGGSVCNQLN